MAMWLIYATREPIPAWPAITIRGGYPLRECVALPRQALAASLLGMVPKDMKASQRTMLCQVRSEQVSVEQQSTGTAGRFLVFQERAETGECSGPCWSSESDILLSGKYPGSATWLGTFETLFYEFILQETTLRQPSRRMMRAFLPQCTCCLQHLKQKMQLQDPNTQTSEAEMDAVHPTSLQLQAGNLAVRSAHMLRHGWAA
jgi:hypothetical protein